MASQQTKLIDELLKHTPKSVEESGWYNLGADDADSDSSVASSHGSHSLSSDLLHQQHDDNDVGHREPITFSKEEVPQTASAQSRTSSLSTILRQSPVGSIRSDDTTPIGRRKRSGSSTAMDFDPKTRALSESIQNRPLQPSRKDSRLHCNVFFPSLSSRRYKIAVPIFHQCTLEKLLELAFECYMEAGYAPALEPDSDSYQLRVCDDAETGEPDEDCPALDKSIPVGNIGVTDFVVVVFLPHSQHVKHQRRQRLTSTCSSHAAYNHHSIKQKKKRRNCFGCW